VKAKSLATPFPIQTLDSHDWSRLFTESQAEGLNMVRRLLDDFKSGVNRFDASGELLLVQVESQVVIGVCGLNREPDSKLERAGRVRRLYICPEYRGCGLATSLVRSVIKHSREYFSRLTVNCGHLPVDTFYEQLGFKPTTCTGITHILELS
jgi:GNAT superfamily N-acetyltransferase